MNRILASAFAFASTAVILGATASGNAYAQPVLIKAPTAKPAPEPFENNFAGIEIAKPVLAVDSGSATAGTPLVIKAPAVMGNAGHPAPEPFENNFPESERAK